MDPGREGHHHDELQQCASLAIHIDRSQPRATRTSAGAGTSGSPSIRSVNCSDLTYHARHRLRHNGRPNPNIIEGFTRADVWTLATKEARGTVRTPYRGSLEHAPVSEARGELLPRQHPRTAGEQANAALTAWRSLRKLCCGSAHITDIVRLSWPCRWQPRHEDGETVGVDSDPADFNNIKGDSSRWRTSGLRTTRL